ncbi:MAG: hypothetical protein ACE5OR_13045 [bacterium]
MVNVLDVMLIANEILDGEF